MAYATVADLEDRYGELSTEQADRAEVLLDDAATMIDLTFGSEETDETRLDARKMVSCSMVNRALAASESDAYGVSNATYTMGPFSQSATFANPSGDLYLTAGERRLLGAGGALIGSIRPVIGWNGG